MIPPLGKFTELFDHRIRRWKKTEQCVVDLAAASVLDHLTYTKIFVLAHDNRRPDDWPLFFNLTEMARVHSDTALICLYLGSEKNYATILSKSRSAFYFPWSDVKAKKVLNIFPPYGFRIMLLSYCNRSSKYSFAMRKARKLTSPSLKSNQTALGNTSTRTASLTSKREGSLMLIPIADPQGVYVVFHLDDNCVLSKWVLIGGPQGNRHRTVPLTPSHSISPKKQLSFAW